MQQETIVHNAIERVTPTSAYVEQSTLYVKLRERSREAFEAVLGQYAVSADAVMAFGLHKGYANQMAQQMWDAWREAILHRISRGVSAVRSLEQDTAGFIAYARHFDPQVQAQPLTANPKVSLQWWAWNLALEFAYAH